MARITHPSRMWLLHTACISLLKIKMQHIEPILVMPALTGTLDATVGQATGEEDSATLENISNDGVALNPEGMVTRANV